MKRVFDIWVPYLKSQLNPWPNPLVFFDFIKAGLVAFMVQFGGLLNNLIYIQSIEYLVIMHFVLMYFFWLTLVADYAIEYQNTFAICYIKFIASLLFYAGFLFFFFDADLFANCIVISLIAYKVPPLFDPYPPKDN